MIFCGNLENCYFPRQAMQPRGEDAWRSRPKGDRAEISNGEMSPPCGTPHHDDYVFSHQTVDFSNMLANMTTSLPLSSNGTIFMSCPNWNHISQYPIKISLAHALNTKMNAIIFKIWNHFDKLHNVPEWTYKRQSLTFLTSIFGFLESMLKLGWDILSDSLME